jgi:hypothetical protein
MWKFAFICKDDYSDDESSFFSNSIRTIMSFEYDDTTKLDDHSANNSATSAANLSPGKDTPRVLLCDNLSAIQNLNKLRSYFPSVNQSDYDILLEIKELIQPTITFQHVKGHQGRS